MLGGERRRALDQGVRDVGVRAEHLEDALAVAVHAAHPALQDRDGPAVEAEQPQAEGEDAPGLGGVDGGLGPVGLADRRRVLGRADHVAQRLVVALVPTADADDLTVLARHQAQRHVVVGEAVGHDLLGHDPQRLGRHPEVVAERVDDGAPPRLRLLAHPLRDGGVRGEEPLHISVVDVHAGSLLGGSDRNES